MLFYLNVERILKLNSLEPHGGAIATYWGTCVIQEAVCLLLCSVCGMKTCPHKIQTMSEKIRMELSGVLIFVFYCLNRVTLEILSLFID